MVTASHHPTLDEQPPTRSSCFEPPFPNRSGELAVLPERRDRSGFAGTVEVVNRTRIRVADLVLLAAAALWACFWAWQQLRYLYPIHGVDLGVYLRSGYAVRHGIPLHGEAWHSFVIPLGGNTRTALVSALPFTYPPFAALLFGALSMLSFATAFSLFTLLNLAAALAIVSIMFRRYPYTGSRFTPSAVAAAAALLLLPSSAVVEASVLGQVSLLLLALVMLDVTWEHHRGVLPAGVLVGVATAVKILPGVVILHWVTTGQLRKAFTAALTTFGCWVFAFLILPGDSRSYFTRFGALEARGQADGNPYNTAFLPTLSRLLGLEPGTAPLLIAAGFILAVTLVASRRAHRNGEPLAAVLLVMAGVSLASPVGWVHYTAWLLPALYLLLARRRVPRAGAFAALVPSAALGVLVLASLPVRAPVLESVAFIPLPLALFSTFAVMLFASFRHHPPATL